jgi:hypothetical protein
MGFTRAETPEQVQLYNEAVDRVVDLAVRSATACDDAIACGLQVAVAAERERPGRFEMLVAARMRLLGTLEATPDDLTTLVAVGLVGIAGLIATPTDAAQREDRRDMMRHLARRSPADELDELDAEPLATSDR